MLKTLIDVLSRFLLPAVFWTLLILVACSWPGKELPDTTKVVGFDKIVHFGLFAVWSVLWLLRFPSHRTLVILVGIGYGFFLELYQLWLPLDRSFDWWDALADGVGVLGGYFFYYFLLKKGKYTDLAS